MEFKHAHDMRVHQVAANAPFPVQQVAVSRVFGETGGEEFECDPGISLAIAGQPDFRHSTRAEPAYQRISLRQPPTFFQHPHRCV